MNKYRKVIISLLMLFVTLTVSAQQRGGFDPQRFEAELESFVVKQAGIAQNEQAAFLKIYREKRQKEVAVMSARRERMGKKHTTEREWQEALQAFDNEDIQLKKIQQTYHNKMLKVIPASKVMKVARAEDEFHRQKFAQHQQRRGQGGARGGNGHGGPRGNGHGGPNRQNR